MTIRSRTLVPGALLLVAALVVAACGGAAATATPSPTTEPGAEATPTTAAEATPTEAAPEATPDLALPTFDLEALTGGLPGVDSYRTETSTGGVKTYESVVVTKPVLSKSITVYDESGEVTQRFVVIGDDLWIADGADGAFEADTTGLGSTMLMAFDPALLLGAYAGIDWTGGGANIGVEDKNGIQAHHIRIDSTTFGVAGTAWPAGAALDIWVADAGYLVAWEMSGFEEGSDYSIQVTNVNDPANKVERP